MRIPGQRGAKIAFAILALCLVQACSTAKPAPSGRSGLLDRMAKLDRKSGRSPAGVPYPSGEGPPEVSMGFFRWPLAQVRVTSPFGRRGDGFHEGLDLHAPRGTPVYAAQSGTVLYAGSRIRGYGRMVVISHLNGLTTVYAHNSRLLVRRGQRVKQGQRIALTGSTGHATGPHLHFEVRKGVAAIDPLPVLPRVYRADAETGSDLGMAFDLAMN